VAIGRGSKLGPFAREADPEKSVSLGPGDASEPATNIRLVAQILAPSKLPMHRQASHMRHADILHPMISPVVAREPHPSASSEHA
jgi:hypothetical protein